MNYKETLMFIGKCLTLASEETHKTEILERLKQEKINWEAVVKVSTSHLILPSLYINFYLVDYLKYLPEELVNFMQHINNLNKDRNSEIQTETIEINSILKKNKITPIFLKGASFLVEDLYKDQSERMIGDIDFIVSDKDYLKAIKILKDDGYVSPIKDKHDIFPSKHYPRMSKKGKIAAVEIHKNIIIGRYSKNYNYETLFNDAREFNDIVIPSLQNQIIHNCINKQFSDYGQYYKSITLRNSYDLYKLSNLKNPLESLISNKNNFKTFNTYLQSTYYIFKSKRLIYKKTRNNFYFYILFLKYPYLLKLNIIFYKNIIINTKIRAKKLFKLTYKKQYWNYYIDKYLNKL